MPDLLETLETYFQKLDNGIQNSLTNFLNKNVYFTKKIKDTLKPLINDHVELYKELLSNYKESLEESYPNEKFRTEEELKSMLEHYFSLTRGWDGAKNLQILFSFTAGTIRHLINVCKQLKNLKEKNLNLSKEVQDWEAKTSELEKKFDLIKKSIENTICPVCKKKQISNILVPCKHLVCLDCSKSDNCPEKNCGNKVEENIPISLETPN